MKEKSHLIAIMLAAGYSRRMQTDKLLLPLQGKALVRHVVEQLISLNFAEIFTVVRHDANQVLLENVAGTRLIRSHDSHKGMGASLAAGMRGVIKYTATLNTALDADILGAIIFLGDMPVLHHETIDKLCEQALQDPMFPHAPAYEGHQGHPVIIPKYLWPALTMLDAEGGAKKLLQEWGLRLMPTHDKNICMDIDTPSEYQALLKTVPSAP